MYIDGGRSGAGSQAQTARRRALLRAGGLPGRRAARGPADGGGAGGRGGRAAGPASTACSSELVPLSALSQPTVSHHLKVLREAGIVGSERRGLWAYYYVDPESLEEFSAWLS